MTNENIKLAIETLKLALKVVGNDPAKNGLVKVVSDMFINEVEKKDTSVLTSKEVLVGETEGKLACVKLLKERTGMCLMDAKRFVEVEFERLGKRFHGAYYS